MAGGSSDSTIIHAVGSRVWIRDAHEGWVRGEVVKVESAGKIVVQLEGSKETRTVAQEDAPLQNNDTRGVEVRARCARLQRGRAFTRRCAQQ